MTNDAYKIRIHLNLTTSSTQSDLVWFRIWLRTKT